VVCWAHWDFENVRRNVPKLYRIATKFGTSVDGVKAQLCGAQICDICLQKNSAPF